MPSQDPKQQELRNRKKVWNGAYKHFSQGLKAFKDSLNGKGKVPSKIQDALPTQLGSMLDGLSQEFEQLVGGAREVFDDQAGYSKNRRKKKPKQPKPLQQTPSPIQTEEVAPPQEKVVQQLSQLGSTETFDLEALGTNRFSRSWQYLKSMFYRDEIKKQRVSLLRMCADLFYSLRNLQNEVLTIDIKNTPNLVQSYQSARYSFSSVDKTIVRLKELMVRGKAKEQVKEQPIKTEQGQASKTKSVEPRVQQTASPAPGQTVLQQSPPTTTEIVRRIMNEASGLAKNNQGMPLSGAIVELAQKFFVVPFENHQEKHAIRNRLQEMRKEMIALLEQERTVKQPATADIDEPAIIKEGHNVLTRFLKRQLTKLRPGNETASLRIDISNSIDEAEKELRVVMDSLHDTVDIKVLEEGIDKLTTIIENIGKPLKVILSLYERDIMKDPENRQKFRGRNQSISGDPSIDLLLKRRIRNDLSRGII